MDYPVEVRQSLIPNSGRGVFTTRDIKKGEKLCFYDGYLKKCEDCDIIILSSK